MNGENIIPVTREINYTCDDILDKTTSQVFITTISKSPIPTSTSTTETEIFKENILVKRLDLDLRINLISLRTILVNEMGPLEWLFIQKGIKIARDQEKILACSDIFDQNKNRINTAIVVVEVPILPPLPLPNLDHCPIRMEDLYIPGMKVNTVDLEDENGLLFIGVTADWLLTGGCDKMLTVINRATN